MTDELLARVIEFVKSRTSHDSSEDCWYSCPAHPEYCGLNSKMCLCDAEDAKALLKELEDL